VIAVRHAGLQGRHALLGIPRMGQPLLHVFAHRPGRLGVRALVVQGHALAARDGHRPGVGVLEPREDPQQRGLARAVPPRHGQAVTGTDPERDVGEERARAKRLGQPRYLHYA